MRKTNVILTDDLAAADGQPDVPASGTVRFALDGGDYEIDLCDANIIRLHELLSPYIKAARKAAPRSAQRSRRRGKADRDKSTEVRVWAKSQGLEISERGRIPAEITDKYNAAH